ncbi:MAG: hypothetical protein M3Q65_21500, partial [Chloroflexota bacterium]|nr:hypothetical protein [Chloroflexota bacterium]
PLPWATALRTARDDVQGLERQVFLSFLIALALSKPSHGCEVLFEVAFEPLHADLGLLRLPHDASSMLLRHLPDLPWWQRWDTCLRLRLAVVTAYVESGLDPQSFRRLTSDSGLFAKLVQLADQTRQGRRFIEQLTA